MRITLPIIKWELSHSIVLMRIFIGWHFLYEGVIKLYNPEWTSFGYLASAQGPFKSLFLALSSEPFLAVVDTLNISALVLVGLTLVAGFFEKLGAVIAILLLAMYYLAHPSFPWLSEVKVEGSYWFVNKNLIELIACMIIFQYPTGQFFGLTYFFKQQH